MLLIFLKDILKVFRKFGALITVNTVGMAVALATFMLVMMQREYESQLFDYRDSERIFMLECTNADKPFNIVHSYRSAYKIRSAIPEVESVYPIFRDPKVYCVHSDTVSSVECVAMVEQDMFDAFSSDFVAGGSSCFSNSDTSVVISSATALQMFGNTDCLGQPIRINLLLSPHRTFTVGGVYDSETDRADVANVIYAKLSGDTLDSRNNYVLFLKLRSAAQKERVEQAVDSIMASAHDMGLPIFGGKYELVNIHDIYYKNDTPDGSIFLSGSKMISDSLMAISLLMLLASAINYINFNLSLIPQETRCTNIHKILGAPISVLRAGVIMQCSIACVAAYILAIAIAAALDGTQMMAFLTAPSLKLSAHPKVLAWTGLISISIGVLTSLYPAIQHTRMQASMALKGIQEFSLSRKKLVVGLLAMQFSFSMIFMTTAAFVLLQNKKMIQSGLGAEAGRVVVFSVDNSLCGEHYSDFRNSAMAEPGIEGVAFSMQLIGGSDFYSTGVMGVSGDTVHSLKQILTTPGVLRVFGIKPLLGQDFVDTLPLPSQVLLSQSADSIYRKVLGNQIDYKSDSSIVRGVVPDINITSLRQSNKTFALVVGGTALNYCNYLYVRLSDDADRKACISRIQEIAKDINPLNDLRPEPYSDMLTKLYKPESNLEGALFYLSIITILISLSGLIVMLSMESIRRRREIAIRKVYGASIGALLLSSNLRYMKVLLLSFALTVPVVIWFVNSWLQMYISRICLSWWVFALVFGAVSLSVLLIISLKTIITALRNPAKSLRE